MKYLSKRSEYLKSAKYKVINESVSGAGPFANDIAWGDSLLGRLLNSIVRKAQIGINLVRMDSVVKRLQQQFDYLLEDSQLRGAEIDEATKKEIDMLAMSIQVGTLRKAIEESDEKGKLLLVEIIKQTKNITYNIESIDLQTDESEPDRKELLVKLNEFLLELESMDKSEVESDSENKQDTQKVTYNLYMDNLKSIRDILNSYKKIKSVITKPKVDENELETNKLKGDDDLERSKSLVDKPVKYNENLSQPSPILQATRSLYNYMMSDPNNLTELNSLIASYDKMSDDQKGKSANFGGKYSSIKKMYDYIKSNSVTENLDNLLSRSEELGKKIKSLYEVSKKGDFKGIEDMGLKNSLLSFNKTLGAIVNIKVNEENGSKILKTFESFISVILESEESQTEGQEIPEGNKVESYDISIPWNKVFNTKYLDKWTVTDELESKLKDKVKSIENDPSGKYLISGIDPIMEIVRIFNRAYKIHTTQTIPGARSGGRVTNRKMGEYTYLGKNSEPRTNDKGSGFSAGIGPYRNNVLFDKWENAVTAIIADSKYQVLFNEKTSIKVGDADTRDGKILLRFINEMLDGDNLYKSGAQSKFIIDYFGIKVEQNKFGYKDNESNENAETAELTKGLKVCEFKRINEINFNKRTIHAFRNDKGTTYYLMFFDEDNDYVYIKYSQSLYYFNRYVKSDAKIEKGSIDRLETERKFPIFYARIKRESVMKGLGSPDILKLKSFNIDDYNRDMQSTKPKETNMGRIENTYSVVSKESGKLFSLPGVKETSSGTGDGNKYKDYKDVLKSESVKEEENN